MKSYFYKLWNKSPIRPFLAEIPECLNGSIGTGDNLLITMLFGSNIVGIAPDQFIHPAIDDSNCGCQIRL